MPAEFCARVSGCVTLDQVRDLFATEIARDGFTASACRIIEPAPQGLRSVFLFRDCPPGWAEFSDERNLSSKSIVIAEARRRWSSFSWDEIRLGRSFAQAQQEVWKAAHDWGWVNGFIVPVHGPNGAFACVGMDSPTAELDLSPANRLRLRLIALLAYERSRMLTDTAPAPAAADLLTARELECLRWVAAGKTDWEIGMILGISPATVKFHLGRARAKLGTSTRSQAVALLALRLPVLQ